MSLQICDHARTACTLVYHIFAALDNHSHGACSLSGMHARAISCVLNHKPQFKLSGNGRDFSGHFRRVGKKDENQGTEADRELERAQTKPWARMPD